MKPSAGKVVVERRAPNSACGSSGVGTLNVYAENNCWMKYWSHVSMVTWSSILVETKTAEVEHH
jgi:hypothetical protein